MSDNPKPKVTTTFTIEVKRKRQWTGPGREMRMVDGTYQYVDLQDAKHTEETILLKSEGLDRVGMKHVADSVLRTLKD